MWIKGIELLDSDKRAVQAERPRLFEELAAYMQDGLMRSLRLPTDQAQAMSQAATDIFRNVWRGCSLFIPIGYRLQVEVESPPTQTGRVAAVPMNEQRRRRLLGEFKNQCQTHFCDVLVVLEAEAERASLTITDLLCEFLAGQNLNVPNGRSRQEISARDQAISDRMGRGMADQLAREYRLTSVRIYQIAKQVALKRQALLRGAGSTATPSTTQVEKPVHQMGVFRHRA